MRLGKGEFNMKKNLMGIIIPVIIAIAYSAIVMIVFKMTPIFWIEYILTMTAFILGIIVNVNCDNSEMIINYQDVIKMITLTFFVVKILTSIVFMFLNDFLKASLVFNIIVFTVYIILVIAMSLAGKRK